MTQQQNMFSHVDTWQASGLSIAKYAEKIGIHKEAFRYWIRKKRKITQKKDDGVSFIELSSMNEMSLKESKTFKENDTSSNCRVALTFPCGMCLKIYQ